MASKKAEQGYLFPTAAVAGQQVAIYGLWEHEGDIRYIGKAIDPGRRLMQHVKEVDRGRMTKVKAWLKSLAARDAEPRMTVLEWCPVEDWEQRERFYIKLLRKNGARLTNIAEGGNEPVCDHATRAANGKKVAKSRDREMWRLLQWFGVQIHWARRQGEPMAGLLEKLLKAQAVVKGATGLARERLRDYCVQRGL